MKLVTVATESKRYFPYLLQSCKRYGAELNVLGWGKPWGGYIMKVQLMNDYLLSLDDNDIVCFIDAYDVILLRPLIELELLFKNTGKQIAIARDTILTAYYFGTCKGMTINSGTYIGYVRTLKQIMQNICNEYNCKDNLLDDQVILTKYCNNNDVYIDSNYSMFIIFALFNRFNIIDKNIVYNGHFPCILHGAGNVNLDTILKQLGYTVSKPTERNYLHYLITNRAIQQFVLHLIFVILIIVCIVLIKKYNLL